MREDTRGQQQAEEGITHGHVWHAEHRQNVCSNMTRMASTLCAAHSMQHAACSTQHTAHSTCSAAQLAMAQTLPKHPHAMAQTLPAIGCSPEPGSGLPLSVLCGISLHRESHSAEQHCSEDTAHSMQHVAHSTQHCSEDTRHCLLPHLHGRLCACTRT